MSDTLLHRLRSIERETRRLHFAGRQLTGRADTARYPVDYYRPAEQLGPGMGAAFAAMAAR